MLSPMSLRCGESQARCLAGTMPAHICQNVNRIEAREFNVLHARALPAVPVIALAGRSPALWGPDRYGQVRRLATRTRGVGRLQSPGLQRGAVDA